MFVSRVKDYDEINDLSSCLRGEDALDIRDISHVHSCSSMTCRRTLYWGFKATLLEQRRGPFTRAIVGLFIARHTMTYRATRVVFCENRNWFFLLLSSDLDIDGAANQRVPCQH